MEISEEVLNRFWIKVDKTATCWLWRRARVPAGYGVFAVTQKWRPYVHRLSWQVHHGRPVPYGLNVLHTCRYRHCVNPAHLWLGTPEDHASWRMEHGLAPLVGVSGRRNRNASLTEEQVADIRASTESPVAVAKKYGITYNSVWKIRTRRTWKHLA